MAQNRLVQCGAMALLVVVIFLGVATCGGESSVGEGGDRETSIDGLSAEAVAGLGIEGDTERDIVATLIGEVRDLKSGMQGLRSDNTALRADNADLKSMEQTIGRRVESQLSEAEQRVVAQSSADYHSMMRRLQEAERQLVQVGNGRRDNTARRTTAIEPSDTVWIDPLGHASGDSTGLFTSLNSAGDGLRDTLSLDQLPGIQGRREQAARPIPYFTIPRNATLVNATALTALVGRVPIGGQVTDPYSFKVIIGRDNLMANGIELPDVAYSVASGHAVGDWTLGCVRGDVFSLTFVFEDGTIRTVPRAEDIDAGSAGQRQIKIGELSDAFGNPCVVGERVSNASTYLPQRIGVTAASAAAEAAAASQTTQITSIGGGGTGVATVVDGSISDFVIGRTIADGSMEVATWLDQRQAQQFDAIYVKPGAQVAMHITEQIDIDYDPLGRKTTHMSHRSGVPRVLD